MNKFIISYTCFILLFNNSYSYSEEVININNEKLQSKSKKNKKKEIYDLSPYNSNLKPTQQSSKKIVDDKKNNINNSYSFFADSFEKALNNSDKTTDLYIHTPINRLPYNIKELKSLKTLSISFNNLSNISGISDIENLEKLDLAHNNIENIPEEIGKLVNLKKLDLNMNRISELPESFGNLINLKYLHLGSQYSENKPKVGSLQVLKKIPNSVFNLKNLEELYLPFNGIQEIQPEIKNLISLKKLSISFKFNGKERIKDSLNNIYKINTLTELNLDINREIDIDESILDLKNLNSLSIHIMGRYDNFFDSSISLINLSNLKSLKFLHIHNMPNLSSEIKFLKNLKSLELSDSLIINYPKEIGELNNLESLKLNNLNLTPDFIKNMTNLKELSLDFGFSIDKDVFMKVSSLKHLESLRITSDLKDLYITNHIINLTSLKELILMNINLRFIPEEISLLKNLETISFSGNKLQTIPDSLKNLTKLKKLILDNNDISESERVRIKNMLPNVYISF